MKKRRGTSWLQNVAIHIIPLAICAIKTAALVQPLCWPDCGFITSDEFNAGMGAVLCFAGKYLEAKPFEAWLRGINLRWPGARVPCGKQVVAQVKDECAVARTHQRMGVGRLQVLRPAVPARAAPQVRLRASTGAKKMGCFFLHDTSGQEKL